jgi:hypothetical protein
MWRWSGERINPLTMLGGGKVAQTMYIHVSDVKMIK